MSCYYSSVVQTDSQLQLDESELGVSVDSIERSESDGESQSFPPFVNVVDAITLTRRRVFVTHPLSPIPTDFSIAFLTRGASEQTQRASSPGGRRAASAGESWRAFPQASQ
jgi:hypothetical protein